MTEPTIDFFTDLILNIEKTEGFRSARMIGITENTHISIITNKEVGLQSSTLCNIIE